ncbi:MAG: PTS fructose transporter subunit IIA [Erysipelotrichaceae bacterium]|jgi:PTS system N-acetylgalactosamine-specific IIA component|nr:PTS fructose transporter subunit IIA [Erysipelotrichaceae bacterium]
MIGVLICGHGQSGSGLKSAAQVIAGVSELVEVVDYLGDESPEQLKSHLQDKIEALKTSGCSAFLVLSDLVGGSPFKAAVELSFDYEEMLVIGGMNLGMVLQALLQREMMPLKELGLSVLEAGKSSIVAFHKDLLEKQEEESTDGI